jgi:hypothetical protein
MNEAVIFVLIVVLVPMFPAWMFFKFLPKNAATVNGKWYGLEIKLTGAFAGYFVLFAAIFWETKSHMVVQPEVATGVLWQVVGQISPNSQISADNQIIADTDPPSGHVLDNGVFEIDFRKGDKDQFPNIRLTCKPDGTFKPITIPLDEKFDKIKQDYRVTKDAKKHLINIDDPVTIVKVPPLASPTPTATPNIKVQQ